MFWVDKFEAAIDPSHFDGNIVWNQNKQSMMHVMKARWDPYGRFSARGAEALHAASRLSFEHSTCKVVVKWQDSGTRHRLIDLIRCHWPIFLIWTASGTHTINFGKPLIPLFVRSWQAQYLVNLWSQFSWWAQYLVSPQMHFSWQAQYLVNLWSHFSWWAQCLVNP